MILGFLFLLTAGAKKGVQLARGIRNNNAGNIRLSNDNWQGLKDKQEDSSFFQFVSPEYGIRALSKLLLNYQSRYGLDTVEGIISRYAPSVENNTNSYINAVSNALGVHRKEKIIVSNHLKPLVNAIIKHENGFNPYSDKTIDNGIALA